MIVLTRTPLRVTLGGGGTDLPFFYTKEDGFWISGAIDKYITILIKPRFEKTLRIAYSALEYVEHPSQLEHPIFREVLSLYEIEKNVEIASFAELPSRSGLGSSGAFTVGLMNALSKFKDFSISTNRFQLAERAFDIEHDNLSRPVGKQDFYSASFGWVNAHSINKEGEVKLLPKLPNLLIRDFENHLSLFYVNQRTAPTKTVLTENTFSNLQKIKQIGQNSFDAIKAGDCVMLGHFMNEHWEIKRQNPSNKIYDKLIQYGRKHGAIGGKLIGAGGGGFLLFIHSMPARQTLVKSLSKKGCKYIPFKFSATGTEVYRL